MNNRKGTILIASIWILAILSVLAIGIGFRVSVEMRLSKYNSDSLKALYLAKAAFVKAQDRLLMSTNPYDSLYECGLTLAVEETPEKIFGVDYNKLGEGSFSVSYKIGEDTYYGMSDEDRKVNINTAPKEILSKLPGIAEEIADSIIYWRSPDPGPDDAYYQSLDPPYKCKHAPFITVEELLLVRGTDQSIFNRVKDYISVHGDGDFMVNVNTATKEVLSCLIMADAATDGITADRIANAIVTFRNASDGTASTEDDNVFRSVDEVEPFLSELSIEGVNSLKKHLKTKSNYFRIDTKGKIDRSRIEKRIAYVVTKEGGLVRLISYREY